MKVPSSCTYERHVWDRQTNKKDLISHTLPETTAHLQIIRTRTGRSEHMQKQKDHETLCLTMAFTVGT